MIYTIGCISLLPTYFVQVHSQYKILFANLNKLINRFKCFNPNFCFKVNPKCINTFKKMIKSIWMTLNKF